MASSDGMIPQANHSTAEHPAEVAARLYRRDAEMEVERLRRDVVRLREIAKAAERYVVACAALVTVDWRYASSAVRDRDVALAALVKAVETQPMKAE